MKEQNFQNHTKSEPKFMIMSLLLLMSIISLAIGIYAETLDYVPWWWIQHHAHIFWLIMIICITLLLWFLIVTMRSYATKLQDRIIRQEVEFRYFVMTQQVIDLRVTLKQMIALRFAWDEEFISLCQQAAEQQLEPTTIKSMIKHWKPDHVRV